MIIMIRVRLYSDATVKLFFVSIYFSVLYVLSVLTELCGLLCAAFHLLKIIFLYASYTMTTLKCLILEKGVLASATPIQNAAVL